MKTKQVKLPGPDHPIYIQPNPARIVVSVAGRVIADTRNALTLREADYPPVDTGEKQSAGNRRLRDIV